jgi:4-hydroxythreonine-4-phosphate dehydrogenase
MTSLTKKSGKRSAARGRVTGGASRRGRGRVTGSVSRRGRGRGRLGRRDVLDWRMVRRFLSGGRAGPPILAVTPGEPGGIGPEITARLFARFRPRDSIALVVGSYAVLEPWLERYRAAPEVVLAYPRRPGIEHFVSDAAAVVSSLAAKPRPPRVIVLDTGCRDRFSIGRDTAGGGRHSGWALDIACRLATEGLVDGIVTGPLSKKSLNLGGYPYTGHTEFLSRYFDAPDCQMVMVSGDFRVVPLTRHIPLAGVPGAITVGRIVSTLRVVCGALQTDFGIRTPRIAVAGLNPHAGDSGVIGSEEADVIVPAIRRARRMGLRVTGPVPGDALFQEARSGTFDAFIAMYHDQGLIPFKMLSQRRGVNVTVGLPIVRTSVDHGTAYDVAGQGVASIDSLREAYRLAEILVRRRQKRVG